MKNTIKTMRNVITVMIALAIVFGAGYATAIITKSGNNATEVNQNNKENDWKLPGEKTKEVITIDEVESKLQEMAELTTYSSSYEVARGKEYSRYVLDDIKIPGTATSVSIKANGIVKIGYDISEFVVKVDDDKIYISLPEAELTDNYIIWDTVECTEENSILNPIAFSQYQELLTELEEEGLEDAIQNQVYEKAEENVKKIIDNFLSGFEGYEVVYM